MLTIHNLFLQLQQYDIRSELQSEPMEDWSIVEPPNKGHLGISHFVLCWEVVPFSEVKNVLLLRERGPEECPL